MINDEQLNDRLIPDLFSRPGPATTVQQRPTPAASRATPRRSCFGRAAGDRRDGGARMPAGRRWEGPCGSDATFDPALDRLQQSASGASCSMVSQPSQVCQLNSDTEVCSDKGGCFSRGSRNRRTANPRGNTRAAVRQKQPRAQSRAPEPSFTARQIGTASNEAFVFRFDKFGKKEERLAPLNFLSALALHLHVTASALHCGQIVRSSRLTLNKSQ